MQNRRGIWNYFFYVYFFPLRRYPWLFFEVPIIFMYNQKLNFYRLLSILYVEKISSHAEHTGERISSLAEHTWKRLIDAEHCLLNMHKNDFITHWVYAKNFFAYARPTFKFWLFLHGHSNACRTNAGTISSLVEQLWKWFHPILSIQGIEHTEHTVSVSPPWWVHVWLDRLALPSHR